MNLLDLTKKAIDQLDTYKYPNIDKWIDAIDPILIEIGQPKINKDEVLSIRLSTDNLHITTSYSVMCCERFNYIKVPLYIISSNKPIKEARIYNLKSKLAISRGKLIVAKLTVESESVNILNLEKKLADTERG